MKPPPILIAAGAAITSVVAGLALGGCASGPGPEARPAPPGHQYAFPVTASAQVSISAANLQDWVTYADAAAVISVERQAEVPPSPADGARLIGRTITVTVQALWRRPGSPALPATITFGTRGWLAMGSGRVPAVFEDGRWLEVGQRYVVPLVRFAADGWGALDDGAVPVVAGRLLASGAWSGNPLVPRLRGDGLGQVAAILDHTPPDPRATPFGRLDPVARRHAAEGSPSNAAHRSA